MFNNWSYDPTRQTYVGIFETSQHLPSGFYEIETTTYNEPKAKVLDRPSDTIFFFENGPMQQAIREISDFYAKGDRYRQLGVSHKRGIMLYGPAGCGKTKIVAHAIDEAIKLGGLAIRMDSIYDFSEAIPLLRQIEPGRPILTIMEDLEQFCDRSEEEVLEVMDGASTVGDNMLFLTTTNHINKIPVRLRCRPSRIDTLIEIGLPTEAHRYEYLNYLLTNANANAKETLRVKTARQWAHLTPHFSLAQLKELVISVHVYEKDVNESIERLRALCETTDDEKEDN